MVCLLDDADYELVVGKSPRVRISGRHGDYPYVTILVEGKRVLLHRYLLSCPSHLLVDHANRNTLDNRRANLRVCSKSQNCQNRVVTAPKTSRFKGVYHDTHGKLNPKTRWRAEIRVDGKKIRLGRFETEEQAAEAYYQAARQLHREFANVSDPSKGTP